MARQFYHVAIPRGIYRKFFLILILKDIDSKWQKIPSNSVCHSYFSEIRIQYLACFVYVHSHYWLFMSRHRSRIRERPCVHSSRHRHHQYYFCMRSRCRDGWRDGYGHDNNKWMTATSAPSALFLWRTPSLWSMRT